ncbi:MAG: chlorite dismutase family protein [Chloroflexi bacterium]|nr:chlorite dismutase family protein [Chloroflexota bacterium]
MTVDETPQRTLSHFALVTFKDAYWTLAKPARAELWQRWMASLRDAAQKIFLFQVFPTEHGADLLVWSALAADDTGAAQHFFESFARATNPHRAYLEVTRTLWGFTRPSQYSKSQRSAQEMDPFGDARKPYLVMYPFTKTTEWYLMGRESRQGMMNSHIRVGKQYEEISQLLLYSTGLQDQEFVVVYEMDNLARFSELVTELRSTDARAYTLSDTPLHTATYLSAETAAAIWQ